MLVSVIIPTYDRPEFTKEAIGSVEAQTIKDLEIIVVEDYSGCVSAARNFGVEQASGQYIAFLDSDDLWDKRKLETQLGFLHDYPEFKICYTNEKWVRNGEHLNPMRKHQKYHGWIFEKCLPLCIISCSSILMEREIFEGLGGFNESLPVCEDYDLWLRMSLKYPIAFLDEPLITKRGGHADQLSRQYWGMDRFRVKTLEKLLRLNLTDEQRRQIKSELSKKIEVLARGCWKHRRYPSSLFYCYKRLRLT